MTAGRDDNDQGDAQPERAVQPTRRAGFLQTMRAVAWRLYRAPDAAVARATFNYSIVYLAALFAALLADHYV